MTDTKAKRLELFESGPQGTKRQYPKRRHSKEPITPKKMNKETLITPQYEWGGLEEAKDLNIIFKPNEGPQTEFLSSSVREVLFGGAAGG